MMIDPAPLLAALDAEPGDTIVSLKSQMRQLLEQLVLGNAARRTVKNIGSIARLQPGCAE